VGNTKFFDRCRRIKTPSTDVSPSLLLSDFSLYRIDLYVYRNDFDLYRNDLSIYNLACSFVTFKIKEQKMLVKVKNASPVASVSVHVARKE